VSIYLSQIYVDAKKLNFYIFIFSAMLAYFRVLGANYFSRNKRDRSQAIGQILTEKRFYWLQERRELATFYNYQIVICKEEEKSSSSH